MTNVDDLMTMSALEAVSCMNAVFSALDKVIDQHKVYKVNFEFETKVLTFVANFLAYRWKQ